MQPVEMGKNITISNNNDNRELNPFTTKNVLRDFTLSNARRFYSSQGNPLAVKGLGLVHTLT